jgi:hypothetical protein
MKSWKIALVAIFTVIMTSQYAFALNIEATYVGGANFGSGDVGYGTGTIWPNPSYPGTPVHQVAVGIGGDNFSTTNTSYDFSSTGSFNTWCVDITHWMITGKVTYDIGGATELANNFGSGGSTRVSDLLKLANEAYSTVDTKLESAAFQLAVWAIMFGEKGSGGYSLNSATFVAPSSDTGYAMAQGWLTNLSTAQVTGNYKITYLYQPTGYEIPRNSQDMVVFTATPVPEPTSMLLLGLGLLGIGIVSRKK